MNFHPNPAHRANDPNLDLFGVRLIAKLCIVVVCAIQFPPRVIAVLVSSPTRNQSAKILWITLAYMGAMIAIIGIEYILFKKKGSKILKYSNIIDLILMLLFIADWILTLVSALERVQLTDPPSFRVTVLLGFTSFSWRTLLVTLIVQKWYLKVVPPVLAISVATGFACYYQPDNLRYTLVRAAGQMLSVVIIIYCDDKLKWRMMWNNLQQEKWIQVNNFILNNIPENIMILDFKGKGEVKFISDYCKSFIQNCGFILGNTTKEFFKSIHILHQLGGVPVNALSNARIQIERLATGNELLIEHTRPDTLDDLISNLKEISEGKDLQEREFLAYNGKLLVEGQEAEKSIEIKISFVQHFKDEYIILILRDTTQRDLLVTLEETNKYKDQLLALVSHELRAPLNGNINLLESAVNSSKISEPIKESLLVPALRSSKFLLHIINDILDMSQIKEKKLRLAFESGDLIETMKSTVQLVELQAKKKGIELLVEIDENLPRDFCTDHHRLSQIILNLLNNAIKFTRRGMVKLAATPFDEDLIKISVEDTGIGMTEENVQKLFSNYTQIEFEGRQNINPTGAGLGLNIAYNLAVLLGPVDNQGIYVSSVSGEGSKFTFILENKEKTPLRLFDNSYEIADERPEIKRPNFLLKSLQSKTSITAEKCSCPLVLIVDDNPFNTMAFETILNSLEMKCDSVYSGACAIKKLLNREAERCCQDCKPYGAVFMDQEMPEMSGSEVVQEIKRLQKENLISSSMKIIGCTAHKSKEEVERFLESGLDQCIHKPISLGMIKNILNEFC